MFRSKGLALSLPFQRPAPGSKRRRGGCGAGYGVLTVLALVYLGTQVHLYSAVHTGEVVLRPFGFIWRAVQAALFICRLKSVTVVASPGDAAVRLSWDHPLSRNWFSIEWFASEGHRHLQYITGCGVLLSVPVQAECSASAPSAVDILNLTNGQGYTFHLSDSTGALAKSLTVAPRPMAFRHYVFDCAVNITGQGRDTSPSAWRTKKWGDQETIVYDAWPNDYSSHACGECMQGRLGRGMPPHMQSSYESLIEWRQTTEPRPYYPSSQRCPDDYHPAVLIRTEERAMHKLIELIRGFFTQAGVDKVTVILVTHSRDTHEVFEKLRDWWTGVSGTYSGCILDVPPFTELHLGRPPKRTWDGSEVETDLDHPDYLDFHYQMYLLTDNAVEYVLSTYKSVTHFLITNGDNLYSADFFRKTCRVARDIVGTGLSHNLWAYRCMFHPELHMFFTDLGSVVMRTSVFDHFGKRFATAKPASITRSQAWYQDMEAKKATHPLWTADRRNHASKEVSFWSAALDGVFFEDVAATPGVSSAIVPQVLFAHS